MKLVGVDEEFSAVAMSFFDKCVDPENPFEKHVRKVRIKNSRADLCSVRKVARMDIVAWFIRIPHFEKLTVIYHFQHTDYLIGRQLQAASSTFNLRKLAKALPASAVRRDFAEYAKQMSLPNITKVIELAVILRPASVLAEEKAANRKHVLIKIADPYPVPPAPHRAEETATSKKDAFITMRAPYPHPALKQ